jgi:hypothetical protein
MIIECIPENTMCTIEDLDAGDVFRYVSGPEDILSDDDDEADRILVVTDEETDDDGDEDVDPDHGRYLCVQLSNGTLWRLSPGTKVVTMPNATLRTGGAA